MIEFESFLKLNVVEFLGVGTYHKYTKNLFNFFEKYLILIAVSLRNVVFPAHIQKYHI